MTEKIRPRSHSSFRDEAEKGLPDVVRASPQFDADEPSNTDVFESEGLPMPEPSLPPATFTPAQAAVARAENLQPNRLGKPFEENESEKLLKEYERAKAAHKANYARTRNNDLEEPFLAAKRAMFNAGLIREV